ncbi:hypothetical protein SRABI106_03911 [Rahnella aquatilis]|nr:hypothetical protein SRABI106_03911 [Rahnella aquatilis]
MLCQQDPCAGSAGDIAAGRDQCLFRPEGFWRDQTDIHSHFCCPDHQGITHIVSGIAQISEADLTEFFTRRVFKHGHQVGKDLGRMKLVGQPVPHRYAGEFRQFFHRLLCKTPVFDAVIHSPQHAGGVFHGFLVSDLAAARAEISHVCALIKRGDFKRTAGAGRGFLKNQRDIFSTQTRAFLTRLLIVFKRQRQGDQLLNFFRCEIKKFKKMTVFQCGSHNIILK